MAATNHIVSSSERNNIAKRIESTRSKTHLKKIFELIHKFGGSDSYTCDQYGVNIDFAELPDEVVFKIRDYLDKNLPIPTQIPVGNLSFLTMTGQTFESTEGANRGYVTKTFEPANPASVMSESEANACEDTETKTSVVVHGLESFLSRG